MEMILETQKSQYYISNGCVHISFIQVRSVQKWGKNRLRSISSLSEGKISKTQHFAARMTGGMSKRIRRKKLVPLSERRIFQSFWLLRQARKKNQVKSQRADLCEPHYNARSLSSWRDPLLSFLHSKKKLNQKIIINYSSSF